MRCEVQKTGSQTHPAANIERPYRLITPLVEFEADFAVLKAGSIARVGDTVIDCTISFSLESIGKTISEIIARCVKGTARRRESRP
jgi:hypothetical protein